MPKRLICPGVGRVEWEQRSVRSLQPHEVRVRPTHGVEKHGTMMAFYKGYANERGSWDAENRMHRSEGVLWNYPIPLGNMQFGPVVEVGSAVLAVQVGQEVSYSGPFEDEAVVNVSDLRMLSPGSDWRNAAMLDPGEFALGAVRDGHVRVGDAVAVFGLGAIGLATVQVARAAGAFPVVAIDPIPGRREVAVSCGAHHVIDGRDADVGLRIRELTAMRGVDVAIDFSGSRHALQAAIRGVGYLGTIVCGAFPPPMDAGLDFGGEAHMNRPTIVFTRACSDPNPDHPRWDWGRIQQSVLQLIREGKLKGTEIVGPVVPFESLLDTYPKIATDPGAALKLAVTYS